MVTRDEHYDDNNMYNDSARTGSVLDVLDVHNLDVWTPSFDSPLVRRRDYHSKRWVATPASLVQKIVLHPKFASAL